MALSLPPNASLENLRKQAKSLLHSFESAETDAVARVSAYFKSTADLQKQKLLLTQSQLVIAREYGFESWAKMKAHVGEASRPMAEPLGKACYHAIERGDLDTVLALLDQGLPINDQFADFGGCSPLSSAAFCGRVEIMRELLARGADPDGLGYANGTGIMLAAWEGQPEPIRLLAEHGANVNFPKPTSGETALHWAAFNNSNATAVSALIELGADVNAVTRSGLADEEILEDGETFVEQGAQSALHFAAYGKKSCPIEIIRFLLSKGANASLRTVSKLRTGGVQLGQRLYDPFPGETARQWVQKQGRFAHSKRFDPTEADVILQDAEQRKRK